MVGFKSASPPEKIQFWELRMKRTLLSTLVVGIYIVLALQASANESGFASAHNWRVEGNKTCFEEHTHTGGADGLTKRLAKNAAIKEWRAFTAWEYGAHWASYRRAASKVVSYVKAEKGWSARVEARPCHSKKLRKRRSTRPTTARVQSPQPKAAGIKKRQKPRVARARRTRTVSACSRSAKKPSYWC